MAKIESVIKDAIARGARKQARQLAGPLRREVRRLRQAVARLRREMAAVREIADAWRRTVRTTPWKPDVSEEEAKSARLSPGLIAKLRGRLKLSQAALSKLLGVSATAVVQWERGRSTPSEQNRRALVALRKLGRRDVRRVLSDMTKASPARVSRPAARRRRRKRK